jgi:hypothetical protein
MFTAFEPEIFLGGKKKCSIFLRNYPLVSKPHLRIALYHLVI